MKSKLNCNRIENVFDGRLFYLFLFFRSGFSIVLLSLYNLEDSIKLKQGLIPEETESRTSFDKSNIDLNKSTLDMNKSSMEINNENFGRCKFLMQIKNILKYFLFTESNSKTIFGGEAEQSKSETLMRNDNFKVLSLTNQSGLATFDSICVYNVVLPKVIQDEASYGI